MNRVDRSESFSRSGRSLVSDPVPRQAPPAPPEVALDDDAFVPRGLRAWAGRATNGLYVQGLVDGDGQTYVTVAIGRQTCTFEVDPANAADAFAHPFAYPGCTIVL